MQLPRSGSIRIPDGMHRQPHLLFILMLSQIVKGGTVRLDPADDPFTSLPANAASEAGSAAEVDVLSLRYAPDFFVSNGWRGTVNFCNMIPITQPCHSN